MRRLITMSKEPSSEIPTRSSHVSVDRYIDLAELEKERIALFRRQPIIVAHVSEVPEPGNFVTEDVCGVPLVVLRDTDSEIRVFVNACRHRGTRLVSDEKGTCKKAITCPYHAWSYRLDGSLLHVPNEEVFDALDRPNLGLRIVQHEVRHGFVWALIDPPDGAALDIAAALGPVLDDDFDAFGLATHHVARKVSSTRTANWKLVMDAFAEGYHLKSLHRTSLSRFFLNGQIVDDCAPHIRQVGARKTLLEAAKGHEDGWDLRRDTTPFYNVFPNAVLVFHPLWLSQMSLMPEGVDRVRVVHRMLVAEEPADEVARARLEKSFTHIHEEVFEKEDLAIAESIQTTLRSGANTSVLMGGLEEGMRLFHLARDRALAELAT
ncbi:MAG: aromatic ring-hydroxylating dioxygenase subunit alpha [Deltaproteobacteria bacterium]|nr:aromatic ring-hydroxylating dioxygenase subunit alpha [Deltaproteobacteria bacterium]